MIDNAMLKYLGRFIPISKWVDDRDDEGVMILKAIVDRMKASGVRAGIAFDKGNCCVYREVVEGDINGNGTGYREWAISIRAHSVRTIESVKYTREYKPRITG